MRHNFAENNINNMKTFNEDFFNGEIVFPLPKDSIYEKAYTKIKHHEYITAIEILNPYLIEKDVEKNLELLKKGLYTYRDDDLDLNALGYYLRLQCYLKLFEALPKLVDNGYGSLDSIMDWHFHQIFRIIDFGTSNLGSAFFYHSYLNLVDEDSDCNNKLRKVYNLYIKRLKALAINDSVPYLAMEYHGTANGYQYNEEYENAVEFYFKSRECFLDIVKKGHEKFFFNAALESYSAAIALEEMEKKDEALATLSEGTAYIDIVLEKDPDDEDYRQLNATILAATGRILIGQGEYKRGKEKLYKAIEIYKTLQSDFHKEGAISSISWCKKWLCNGNKINLNR